MNKLIKKRVVEIFNNYGKYRYLDNISKKRDSLKTEFIVDSKYQIDFSSGLYISENQSNYGNVDLHNRDLENEAKLCDLLLFQLNETEQSLVNLRYFEGLYINRICQMLYISEATLFRKFQKIFQKLEEYIGQFEDVFM